MEGISLVKKFVEGLTFEKVKEKCDTLPYNFKVIESDDTYMISFTEKSNLSDDLTRHMNGVIFEKETNKLLHYSFQKAYEGIYNEFYDNEKDSYRGGVPENLSIEISTEGTHIKVYWYSDKWNISTSRVINTSTVHWNTDKSFKEMFLECCEYEKIDLNSLDKEFCYSFIMQHPENLIMNNISVPYCNMINKVDLKNETVTRTTLDFNVNDTLDTILEKIKTDPSFNYIVYFQDSTRIKLLNENFKKIQKIIKNDNFIERVYLRALQNGESIILKKFLVNKKEVFEKVESIFDIVILEILKMYKDRYVFKSDPEVYHKYEKTLKQLHWFYRKTHTKIDYDIVFGTLINLNINTLLWILDISFKI